jgi:hypothetical protein
MNAAARFSLTMTAALAAITAVAGRAEAMPPFAQAYGMKCSVCHTQVPALNAYGRYVQRTGYASLDPHVLKRANPIWLGENTYYDTQQGTYKTQLGNVAIHAVGTAGNDVTYHFQQWILQNDQAGNLDTFWLTYNNLLHRDGHLFVGLLPLPSPSEYGFFSDLSGFASAEYGVGEHAWALDANAWGAKFNYVRNKIDVEAGWVYGSDGWSSSSAFANSDKRLQYRVAFATPDNPFEGGVFGSRGSWPLAEGGTDQYWSLAAYGQRDPHNGVPGFFASYNIGLDGNPLAMHQSAGSNSSAIELYQPWAEGGMISIRKEWTNDGLGTLNQSGVLDVNYQVAKYLRLYGEESFASHSTPGFRWMLWWTTPITAVK